MGMCQWAVPLESDALLKSLAVSMSVKGDKTSAETTAELAAQVRYMKETVAKLRAMKVDFTEFACLKAIALFKAGTPIPIAQFYLIEGGARKGTTCAPLATYVHRKGVY